MIRQESSNMPNTNPAFRLWQGFVESAAKLFKKVSIGLRFKPSTGITFVMLATGNNQPSGFTNTRNERSSPEPLTTKRQKTIGMSSGSRITTESLRRNSSVNGKYKKDFAQFVANPSAVLSMDTQSTTITQPTNSGEFSV